MFFGDRVAALTNIGHALRPGGRMVLLTWQPPHRNEWIQDLTTALAAGRELPTPPPDAPGPFTLADPDVIHAVLADAGYRQIAVEGMTAPMWFGHATEDAFQLVTGLLGWMLEGLDQPGRSRALDDLRATIAAHETPEGVLYGSGAWITPRHTTMSITAELRQPALRPGALVAAVPAAWHLGAHALSATHRLRGQTPAGTPWPRDCRV
jgi:SAM-dependent methyltransferase